MAIKMSVLPNRGIKKMFPAKSGQIVGPFALVGLVFSGIVALVATEQNLSQAADLSMLVFWSGLVYSISASR